MIKCREAAILAERKMDGELSIKERLKLTYHMAVCKYCRRFKSQIEWLIASLHEWDPKHHLSEYEKSELKQLLKSQ